MITSGVVINILHIIIGLNVGGAELMLKRLIESNKGNTNYRHAVISLTSLGKVGQQLQALGVEVQALNMRSLLDIPRVLWRLVWLIRASNADIVQTWLYHADLLGGLVTRFTGFCPVVWGIRCTTISQGPLSVTFWLVRLCAILSHIVPHRIICCANSAKLVHTKLGYSVHKMSVISNGYDFSVFDRSLGLRTKARTKLRFNVDEIVIGTVGRFDLIKDFNNFVAAAYIVAEKQPNVKFLMVGHNIEWSNHTLRGWIESAGLENIFQLVGEQSDIPYFLSAMDIFCLSSACGEGFPNVVVEAMAMGLPCVVTHVGDAADILGDGDYVVPVKDSISLGDALLRMCDLKPVDRRVLGERNAKRVREEYGIEKIRRKYEAVYDEVSKK